jgi:hypothetical protein
MTLIFSTWNKVRAEGAMVASGGKKSRVIDAAEETVD